ncbi:MAG TPA: MFS transporter, partial [Oceanicaulis sp.]|nr:MFS transporter [Oceanicaulis sp.]
MLLVIYIFNFLDRQIVNILAEPIKLELGLADWQLGMLTGLAFAAFYTVLGIPIARYAEKADRVKIISVAVAVWSAFTIACGLAANFTQLLLARIGVGVGEAGCSPPAHSLITDYTPKEERASALAFYSMGIPLGSLVPMALGGLIADAFGWRAAFFVAGAPGIILAVMAFLTLPEPRRGLEKKVVPVKGPSFVDAIKELKSKKSFWWISIGAALSAMVGYGHIAFYGSFYLRNHGEGLTAMAVSVNEMIGVSFGPIGFVGTALGLIIGVCGAAGTFLGGVLADR